MTTPKPPRGLGEAGQALWDSMIPEFTFNPGELVVLRHACREEDLITRLEEAQAEAELVTRGSMGQEVSSPYASELRQHRALQANLIKQLKIPDTPAGAARKKAQISDAARKAARTRWGSGAGTG
jgi:hypothetical protein